MIFFISHFLQLLYYTDLEASAVPQRIIDRVNEDNKKMTASNHNTELKQVHNPKAHSMCQTIICHIKSFSHCSRCCQCTLESIQNCDQWQYDVDISGCISLPWNLTDLFFLHFQRTLMASCSAYAAGTFGCVVLCYVM